jgi:predicted nucleic acid-binding protein
MNVVDSSGWLEYLADSPNADFYADAIEDTEHLIVPAISLFEVFKRILQQRVENEALQAVALMMKGTIVELDVDLSIEAALVGTERKLPLADSILLATARKYYATIWTKDRDFEHVEGVRFLPKSKA